MARQPRALPICIAPGFATDRDAEAGRSSSLDLRVQHALRDELVAARDKFKAKAAAGIITRRAHRRNHRRWCRCRTTIPTIRARRYDPTRINRLTTGVYEMGSTFKALTLAMALDSGKVDARHSTFDARAAAALRQVHHPRLSRAEPRAHACRRSSPTRRTSAPRAWRWQVGVEEHKAFLRKLGQLDRLRTELPESAEPIVPKRWGELNTVTIAFGHGLSVAPLQAVMGVAALVNGGC